MKQPSLRWYMFLSIAAALVTMGVKFIGYFLTGSVGLFSDAAESVVNLVAALVGLWAVTLAARPADDRCTGWPDGCPEDQPAHRFAAGRKYRSAGGPWEISCIAR